MLGCGHLFTLSRIAVVGFCSGFVSLLVRSRNGIVIPFIRVDVLVAIDTILMH